MREHKELTSALSTLPHLEELSTLADLAGVRMPPDVMRILIELVSLNVPPANLYTTLRDILVKRRHAKGSGRHFSRRSVAQSAEASGSSSVCSGPQQV